MNRFCRAALTARFWLEFRVWPPPGRSNVCFSRSLLYVPRGGTGLPEQGHRAACRRDEETRGWGLEGPSTYLCGGSAGEEGGRTEGWAGPGQC